MRLVVPLVALALALSGCTGSSQDSTAAPTSAAGAADTESLAPSDTGASGVEALARIAPTSSVIRTGELQVLVDDVRTAADEAARVVTAAGGVLEGEDRSSDGEQAAATLRLRLPPEQFDPTVARLADLGTELARRLGSEDVTEQVIDLDSRLATQRASVERVRALLAEADDLGEVVQVEGELTRRTADLESLQTRLTALTSRVELSSLTLQLSADRSALSAVDGPAGFSDGLREGWAALVAVGRGIGVAAGALLPFTPLLVVAGSLVWRARRAKVV